MCILLHACKPPDHGDIAGDAFRTVVAMILPCLGRPCSVLSSDLALNRMTFCQSHISRRFWMAQSEVTLSFSILMIRAPAPFYRETSEAHDWVGAPGIPPAFNTTSGIVGKRGMALSIASLQQKCGSLNVGVASNFCLHVGIMKQHFYQHFCLTSLLQPGSAGNTRFTRHGRLEIVMEAYVRRL